jgi:hypothetical protein
VVGRAAPQTLIFPALKIARADSLGSFFVLFASQLSRMGMTT